MAKGLFDLSEENINSGDFGSRFRHSWVEESFNFSRPTARQLSLPGTRDYLGGSIAQKKIRFLFFLILLGMSVIGGKVFYLQIVKGDYYRSLAEGNRIRLRPIPAERGIIYDRFNRELVENVPSFNLSIVPQDLPADPVKKRDVLRQVTDSSGVPAEQINDLLKKYGSYSYESLVIKENLDYDSALKLYIRNASLPGVLVEKSTKRRYLQDTGAGTSTLALSFSHLLGYMSKLDQADLDSFHDGGYLPSDVIGKSGLEKQYEADLRGHYGKKKVEVDALGREQSVLAEEAPVPGKNLILTIDVDAQKKLEELLQAQLKKLGKKRGVAIALNPNDGGILAMVSLPAFDNNLFSGGISQENYAKYTNDPDRPLFNRAIGGNYPSGSTVKPVVAAAALEEKIISKTTSVLSTGGIKVDRWFFQDWKAGGHGITDVTKAIAWSVNTFFYYIGGGYNDFKGLGIDLLVKYFRAFNLGSETGVDLPGENSGFVPTPGWKENTKHEQWYIGDTYNVSIGQGDLLVTPLQLAVWTAAVANGGTVIRPHLSGKLFDSATKIEMPVARQILNQNIVSPYNMEIVRQGMRECVLNGSCQLLKSLSFTSGGKTGTAQWSNKYDPHAWFTSFAPYASPKIAVSVLIEEGKEGSTAAMPVARDFLEWWGKKYLTR